MNPKPYTLNHNHHTQYLLTLITLEISNSPMNTCMSSVLGELKVKPWDCIGITIPHHPPPKKKKMYIYIYIYMLTVTYSTTKDKGSRVAGAGLSGL